VSQFTVLGGICVLSVDEVITLFVTCFSLLSSPVYHNSGGGGAAAAVEEVKEEEVEEEAEIGGGMDMFGGDGGEAGGDY
jgi:hypothetical protein